MKIRILLLIIGLNIIPMTTMASEWEEHSATIKWGESASFYNYNITAVDFRPGTIKENPEKCKDEADGIKRRIFGCDDWVLLSIYKDGGHVLDTALAKENHTFADRIEFLNETTYEDDESSFKIIVLDVITGTDIITPYTELKILTRTNEFELDITKNLTISKTVPEYTNVNPCYQSIPITLSVENIGELNFSYIRIVDDIGDKFTSEPSDLKWSISLRKDDIWQTEYLIKPIEPIAGAEYDIPPATLYLTYYDKTYNLSTGSNSSFILRSSDIILSKTIDNETEDNITVNLRAKNNGSRAALVKVWDYLLPDMEIISGDTNFSIVLQPGEFYNQSYISKLNNLEMHRDTHSNVSIPPANFTFKEYKPCYDPEGNPQAITGYGISNPAQINFAEVVPTSVQTISPDQTTPTPSSSVGEPPTDAIPGRETFVKNLTTGIMEINGYKLPYTYLVIIGILLVSIILFVLRKNKGRKSV